MSVAPISASTLDSPVAASTREIAGSIWIERLTRPAAAAIVWCVFWVGMVSSVRDKSLTADEAPHAAAGYAYWKFNDYRLNPENGNLPQRVMGLPLALDDYRFPAQDSELWRSSDAGAVGDAWFHDLGNDLPEMLLKGRATIALLSVALGALVWFWARQLFGAVGGMLSLVAFVLNPTILANGPLLASDAAAALFFLAATLALWSLLHRMTAGRVLASVAMVGCLFLSKLSAVLIVPIGLALAIARLFAGRPLWLGFGVNRELRQRLPQAWAIAGAVLLHVLLVPIVVWSCYGFRYSAFPPSATAPGFRLSWEFVLDQPEPLSRLREIDLSEEQKARANAVLERFDWNREGARAMLAVRDSVLTAPQAEQLDRLLALPPPELSGRVIQFFRQHELLPEAFLYGAAHLWRFSRVRAAYFNGEYGINGWKSFFPYTVLVKTPLGFFALLGLALAAAIAKWRAAAARSGSSLSRLVSAAIYATLPLWVLLVFYWAAMIPSHLNIGHRYMMPTYPPMLVLCGAAAWWLPGGRKRAPAGAVAPTAEWKAGRLAVIGLVAILLVETAVRYPNYLAYFNGIVSPARAYRHLVDSSLDWGQDLPAIKRYIDARPGEGPFYLSYFGGGRPSSYGISATLLICPSGLDRPRTPVRIWRGPEREANAQVLELARISPDLEIVARRALPDGQASVTFLPRPAVAPLTSGTYLISATMWPLHLGDVAGALGPWNDRFESIYQEHRRQIAPLLAPEAADRAQAFSLQPVERWNEVFEAFVQFRFARLLAYLRQREPDDAINYSVLVYKLSAADLERALDGPPPERGIDLPTQILAQLERDRVNRAR